MYEISATGESVEYWSSFRLPFEPKGEALALRSELRSALRELNCADGAVLSALYQSGDTSMCDPENVLFYNVGIAAFRRCPVATVQFWRETGTPSRAPSGQHLAHYVRYGLDSVPQHDSTVIARLHSGPLGTSSLTRPWLVWQAVKEGNVETLRDAVHGPFRLDVTAMYAPRRRPHPTAIMKTVLDGLICALHVHDGSDLGLIAERLARTLPASQQQIEDMLMDDASAVLGRRRLVWPFRQGVQMNPGDDALSNCTLTVRPSDGEATRITAQVMQD